MRYLFSVGRLDRLAKFGALAVGLTFLLHCTVTGRTFSRIAATAAGAAAEFAAIAAITASR